MFEIPDMIRDVLERPAMKRLHSKITMAKMRVVSTVFRHSPRSIMLKDLAQELDVTPSAVSQTVDALVKDGMIERHRDENDRRAVAIRASKKAESFKRRYDRESGELMEQFLRDVPDEDRSTFVRVLEIVHERAMAAVQNKASGHARRKKA
jgi:DNA-binding MarR family transcriptional regulator